MSTRTAFIATSVAVLSTASALSAPTDDTQLEEVTVLGSRIARTHAEGPSPVTVITALEMQANGYASISDVLRGLSQNGGETQSQQSSNAGDFTPGAQQVDLRGLGPNHTLVLVNGRRIADFPLPFNGKSNFTDISNIPLGMVEKIEVLSGSASAIYGSDAISGVVNFQLKKQVNGTTLDVRLSNTEKGGGASQRFALSTGWNKDAFSAALGLEFMNQEPLWAWNRSIQDSTYDAPTLRSQAPRRTFLRLDTNGNYFDPGTNTCASLAKLNNNSTMYASRPGSAEDSNGDPADGFYCGSANAISYGTIISGRRGINAYATLNWDLSEHMQLFADIQYGYSKVRLFNDVTDWQFEDANFSEDGYFVNSQIADFDSWYRQFTPEEMGGFSRNMITNNQTTLSVTPGIKGSIGENTDNKGWRYEAYLNHSQYDLVVSWPLVIRDKANTLFLGNQNGTDPDYGYPVFDADPARLYTPLTRAEYDSITSRTTYHPHSSTDTVSLVVNTPSLFQLPAGDVGFATVAELGRQSYRLNVEPLALTNYYYAWRDTDGSGSRNHSGLGVEFRAPLLKQLIASAATRYDSYRFADNSANKFTYNLGLEWRPVNSLLIRGAYGTGFRAPDLHYVFSGPGNTHPSATDYYLCRTQEPDSDIGDCSYSDEGVVQSRVGNRKLQSETSTSLNYGIVWAPSHNFDVSVDFFDIHLDNEVEDINIDSLLRVEADCRIGSTTAGSTIDVNSPTCVDAISRVTRYAPDHPIYPDGLLGVRINPINVAQEHTSGVDLAMHYNLQTGVGNFGLTAGYTKVKNHTVQQYPGDPVVDKFAVDSNYDIPRSKANASVSWNKGDWTTTLYGERLDKLPNYDQVTFIKATYLFNGSIQWKVSDHAKFSMAIDNLFDTKPPKDDTYTGYPYYDTSWFDSVGRSYNVQMTYKFGGKL